MRLSIIIITHNNQAIIKDCLKTAQAADEIIVVDDHSTDDTVKLSQAYTKKIFPHSLKTFAAQRSWGAKKASGDWLFFLDADERLSAKLFQEIKKTIVSTSHSAFRLKRQNYFLGRLMRHSGFWPDWQTRLFKASSFQGINGSSHEEYRYQGCLGSLTQPLIHLADRRVIIGLRKSILWTKPEAEALFRAGHPPVTWWRLLKVIFQEFFRRYFKQQGWRDGYPGLTEALTQSFNQFFIYQQLWELQHQEEINQRYQQLEKELL
jgi:glycosyltransferase involved in cell wall biosynthesis